MGVKQRIAALEAAVFGKAEAPAEPLAVGDRVETLRELYGRPAGTHATVTTGSVFHDRDSAYDRDGDVWVRFDDQPKTKRMCVSRHLETLRRIPAEPPAEQPDLQREIEDAIQFCRGRIPNYQCDQRYESALRAGAAVPRMVQIGVKGYTPTDYYNAGQRSVQAAMLRELTGGKG